MASSLNDFDSFVIFQKYCLFNQTLVKGIWDFQCGDGPSDPNAHLFVVTKS